MTTILRRIQTAFAAILCLAGSGLPQSICAQPVLESRQDLSLDRPESWAMAYMTAATLFHGMGGTDELAPGQFSLGLELANIPHIDQRDTQVGFNGSKFEDLNKSPVFGRARLWLGLPWRFVAEAAYTPEISIDGARPDGFYAAALSRSLVQFDRGSLGARIFAQSGRVRGDFTCSRETASAGDNVELNPFGCQGPSDDEAEFDYTGLELNWRYSVGRWQPFASWSATRIRPQVQVNARTFDVIDRALLNTRGTLRSGVAGVALNSAFDLRWSLALSYTPLEVRRRGRESTESDDFWSLRLVVSRPFGPR
ncbi:MAG: hypothetical protein AB8B96_09685 [Lysobacterales bacterium]